MTWTEVVDFALFVVLVLGFLFFLAVILNGWPGSRDD